jgi:hypothetical protein
MHLRRIDPDRNMARFYRMSLQQQAALAMAEHLKAKLSKVYEAV